MSVSLISRVLCGFAVFGLSTALLRGQDNRTPQELLKEAEALRAAGKLDQAIADYKLILEKYPDVPQVRSNLGAALAAAGRYEEAVAEYQRALQLAPLPEIQLNLALAYYKMGRLGPAVEILKKIHEQKPDDLRPVMLLGDCHLRLGQNKEVISLLTPIQQSHPDDLGLVYMLGTALVRDGQVAKGQVLINEILKNGDSAEARLLLGTTKFQANDFAGALVDLQKAVELNPSLPDLYAYYGQALMATGDPEGAQKAFKQALQDDPNSFDANLRMGVLSKENQNYDEALGYLHHALDVRPGDMGVRYQIAAIELEQGQTEKARLDLESIVKEAPNFTEAHVSLATALYREKRKAEGDRERAIVAKLQAEKQANEPGVKVAQ
ncbi:MAG TPA: tetratricopeptide repeat protein [Terriglobia bacterium]|nr:tetratricopeptide repeat protein [Terriglobia bacterium]